MRHHVQLNETKQSVSNERMAILVMSMSAKLIYITYSDPNASLRSRYIGTFGTSEKTD